jgi:hypothetical protein
MNSACNCCAQPPCPTPTLEFLSLNGYVPCPIFLNPADGQYYDTITETNVDNSTTATTAAKDLAGDCVTTVICSGGWTEETVYDNWRCAGGVSIHRTGTFTLVHGYTDPLDPCALVCEASGTVNWAVSEWGVADPESYNCTETIDPECETSYNVIDCPEGAFTYGAESSCPSGEGFPADNDVYTRTPPYGSTEATGYSNEADLEFPAWHTWDTPDEELLDGQGRTGVAAKHNGKVVSRVKWRVRNLPSGTCYLRVWIKKTFMPDPADPVPGMPPPPPPVPVITILEPAVWEGEGTPCFEFPLLGAGDPDNTIFTPEVLNPDPTLDGTETFELIKWACVPDYEPEIDNPAKPNGYPNPT